MLMILMVVDVEDDLAASIWPPCGRSALKKSSSLPGARAAGCEALLATLLARMRAERF